METASGDAVAFIVRGRVDPGFAAEAEKDALFLACLRSSLRYPGTTFTVPSGAARTRASSSFASSPPSPSFVREGPGATGGKQGKRGASQESATLFSNYSSATTSDARPAAVKDASTLRGTLPNGLPVSLFDIRCSSRTPNLFTRKSVC